nr:alcohol dehydrogenase catalytic domain-containing protein [Microbacterium sp. NIBRBAC000506063]
MDARTESTPPLVLGSDGIGVVVEVGAGVSASKIGRRVIINPCLGWDDPSDVPIVPEILGDPRWGRWHSLCPFPPTTSPPHRLTSAMTKLLRWGWPG